MAFFNPLTTEQRVLIQVYSSPETVEAIIVDSLEADVSENENYTFDGNISELTIEDGSKISDHITILPIQADLDLRFSDTPFSKFNPLKSLEAEVGRGRKAALKLIGWHRDKERFILTTSLASFDNMGIKRIEAPRSSADGRSVLCRVTFKEIPVAPRSGLQATGFIKSVITEVEHTIFGPIALGDLS